jgi:DNA-binding NarL/FixJ family response regulator
VNQAKDSKASAKVLIVGDHPAVREALALRISELPDLEVCGEAANLVDALILAEENRPDLAVIDISLKTGDGLDLIKRIKAKGLNVQMLVWSMHSGVLYAERALRAGARGFINKEQATTQIFKAMRDVIAGKVHLGEAMIERLLRRATVRHGEIPNCSPLGDLSDRELEVMRLIGQGLKTGVIAEHLHLSAKTVETYRDRIRQKLCLSNRTELLRYATQRAAEANLS